MQALELKIPPLVLVALLGLAMWLASRATPAWTLALPDLVSLGLAGLLALAGIGFSLAGKIQFGRARTTVNPMKPGNSSALVTAGVYQITRNPMYVGFLLALTAWAVFLANPAALLGPVCFVPYMNRFQIEPEERALTTLFGAAYSDYLGKVRRWL